MSIQNQRKCIVCEKVLAPGIRGGQRKFCSTKCGSAYHNLRNAGKPTLPGGRVQCPQCGVEFERPDKTKRECCTRTCALKWNRRKEVEEIQDKAAKQKALENPGNFRFWVLVLHTQGYSRGAIALALGLNLRTFRGWISQYNKEGLPKGGAYQCSYSNAQTIDEWFATLRGNTKSADLERSINHDISNRQVYLVNDVVAGGKGADCLSADIYARLKMDPFSGDVFVYCSKRRDRIRYIYWNNGGFNVVSRRKERGGYPWPPQKFGTVIPVTGKDLDLILQSGKSPSTSST